MTSAFDTIARGALGPEQFVTLGTLTLLATSGLCMRSWLLVHVSRKRALAGGVAYVLAPYHLYDIYARGALAEASAYASVPLIMLALARLSDGRRGALPLLSVAYAAVLFSHLPTALLVSLFLIAPYVTFLAATSVRPLRFIASSLTGGLVGIGLAAIYLVPALTLLTYVSARALSGGFYRPDNWFFWHIRAGLMSARMYLIVPVTLAAFALAAQSVRAARGSAAHRSALFWASLTIFLTVIIAGVVPGVWHLPGLKLVQFPWRALLLVEFTTITMLTLHFPRLKSPMALCAAALLAFAYCVLALMIGHTTARTQKRQEQTAAEIRAGYLDAPEYLPAGTKIVQGAGPDDLWIQLPQLPLAHADSPAAEVRVSEADDGAMTIKVVSPSPTRLVLRRFYFPHWRAEGADGRPVALSPDPRDKVVTFRVPAGYSTIRLFHGAAPHQDQASLASLLALLAVAIMAVLARLRPRPPYRPRGGHQSHRVKLSPFAALSSSSCEKLKSGFIRSSWRFKPSTILPRPTLSAQYIGPPR